MNQTPKKLRNKWKEEDLLGITRVCMRADEGDCKGRVTKEHAIIYASKQLHSVNRFQDTGSLNKEKHIWIVLNRAPESRLRELSKAINYIDLKKRLNNLYGQYKIL